MNQNPAPSGYSQLSEVIENTKETQKKFLDIGMITETNKRVNKMYQTMDIIKEIEEIFTLIQKKKYNEILSDNNKLITIGLISLTIYFIANTMY